MNIYSVTRQGEKRQNNEDHFLFRQYNNDTVLLAIADGMGGHAAGEVASEIAINAIKDLDPNVEAMESHLAKLLQKASLLVQKRASEDSSLEGMGTTLSVVLVRNEKAYWIHVGDTRIYLFRDGRLYQITEDHTMPQLFVKEGKITKEEARLHPLHHALLNCIGPDEYEADQGSFLVAGKDLLMLSTDGLHDALSDVDMESILGRNADLKEKVNALVSAALQAEGEDDITVITVELF
ncbi:MAG: protein phosphatase 2C domain-containing protein [Syntrophales bacterium]|nr:protein phosphatase 2C domain-containing protein [Syntrophales bacterium]